MHSLPVKKQSPYLFQPFILFFFWQSRDSPWTVCPDLTWKLQEHLVQPDQSKPSLPIRFTVRFHKIALTSHIKPAENAFFFFSFYKPEEEAKPIHQQARWESEPRHVKEEGCLFGKGQKRSYIFCYLQTFSQAQLSDQTSSLRRTTPK